MSMEFAPQEQAEAEDILRRYPAVDLHADPFLWARLCGYDLNRRHTNPWPRAPYYSHSDVPRWKTGGVQTVFTGIVTLPGPIRKDRGTFEQAMKTVTIAEATAAASKGAFCLLRSEEEYQKVSSGQAIGGLLALEGVHAVEGSLENFSRLVDRGLRSVGLAHFHQNAAVAPSFGPGGDHGPLANPKKAAQGLSDFGRSLVELAASRGVIIDLAHTARAGFMECTRRVKQPLIVSHTGLHGAHPHWRNIDDEQIRAVADKGGVIGVIFAGRYLGGGTIAAVVRHITYLVRNFSLEVAAIGSDFDGMIVPVRGLFDVTQLWKLVAALRRHGFNESQLAAILRHNALRVVESVTGWRKSE